MKKTLLFIAVLSLLAPVAARAEYKYTNAEGEYIISLPDAPLAETIWAQNGRVPLIDNAPKYGPVGEYVLVKRVDPDTNDIFEVRITFVKADRDFLLSLTDAQIEKSLNTLFADTHIRNPKFNLSKGTDTLRWGTLSGFSVSQNNDSLYNIGHYLVGQQSIEMVKVSYSLQNDTFKQYYKDLAKSIAYMGQ